jgi:CrcB protein
VKTSLLIALGGGCGAMLRGLCGAWLYRRFPAGTLLVNLLGCLAIGLVMGLCRDKPRFSAELRDFLVPGVFGGLTTFSTFGYQTIVLIENDRLLLAGVNVVGNLVGGLLAVVIGLWAARLATGT